MTKYLILAVFLIGCTDPYAAARTTLVTAQKGIELGDFAAKNYIQSEAERCAAKPEAERPACLATSLKVKEYWPKSAETASAAISTALSAIDAAEKKEAQKKCETLFPAKGTEYTQCVARNKPNWTELVKKSICLVAASLGFLPENLRSRLQRYLDLAKTLTCSP